MTNTFILCVSLLTNSQQAIVGQANGRALVVSQDTVVRRTVTVEDVLLSSSSVTNAVPIAMQAPPSPVSIPPTTIPPATPSSTNAPAVSVVNTNSPGYRHRMERERMRGTNAPPAGKQ